jgi:hypothetical protein
MKTAVAQPLYVKMILSAWDSQNTRIAKLLDTLTDEQLQTETAPDRNTGVYLIGHLAAVSDGMFPLLGLGQRLYPQLENVFIKNPEKAGLEKPSLDEIKKIWKEVNDKLSEQMHALSEEDWFARHTAVSAEDFAKEPHRNKLNILINRTNHSSYHIGQMVYLVKKSGN